MPSIKLSEIRAKFPMYSDLSDEQLIGGIRNKFYSDIPMGKFAGMIDYDTQREKLGKETTDGMGAIDTLRAGVGKGFADAGRGVGQMLGLVSRGDVAESRKLDKALMDTTGGKVGNVFGSAAVMAPTALIPFANTYAGAAAIGALSGLAAPSVSTEETLKNAGLGGVVGAGAIGAGRALGSAATAFKALLDPFSKAGQDRIAARTLQGFVGGDPAKAAASINARELVPGSRPTLAQATGNPGLAQLERTLANNPETGPALAAHYATQRAARLKAVQDVAGTEEYYQGIKEGIKTFGKQDYDAAIAKGFDPQALTANKARLNALLARPSIKGAQDVAKRLAAENGESLTELGSVRGLDYLVKALDNEISKASGAASSVGKAELRALTGTKSELSAVLEEIAPAYREASRNYAQMSKQVNSMDAARDVLGRMQSPLGRYGATTNELRNEYARALEAATESVKRSTGQNKALSDVMPTKDIAALEAVAKDMARQSAAENLGRATGSNTAQNLAAQNLLRRALGPSGLPQSWAESSLLQGILSPYTGVAKLAGSEARVMNRLAEALVDPTDAAALLMLAGRPNRVGLLGEAALPVLPGQSVGLLTDARQ